MSTIGALLLSGVIVWAVFRLGERGGQAWQAWVAFGLALLGGVCLLATPIPGWLTAIPGGVIRYVTAAGLTACFAIGLTDLPRRNPGKPRCLVAGLAGPLCWVLGGRTAAAMISEILEAGARALASSIT